MTSAAPTPLPIGLRASQGLAYGLMGLPLAFVALPLYVLLPNHYARAFGMPLATLGAVLLAARLLDAVSDPLLGRLSDHLFGRSVRAVLGVGAVSAAVLALGLAGLFFPQVQGVPALTVWAFVALLVTYAAYSQLGIAHQSWGARLGAMNCSAAASWPGAKVRRWWVSWWLLCCLRCWGFRRCWALLCWPWCWVGVPGRARHGLCPGPPSAPQRWAMALSVQV